MISPSEDAVQGWKATTESGMSWHPGSVSGSVSVFPLEFQAVDAPRQHPVVPAVEAETDADITARRLREEMEALDTRLRSQAQQISTQLEEARHEARLEARREWEQELEERIRLERGVVTRLGLEFAQQRSRYFSTVEAEIVRLALAIAARVLHREAGLDPLLLSGAVRVALERVTGEGSVVLHVPAAEVERWRGVLSQEPGSTVEVVGEEGLEPTDCFLETSVGKVELGVAVQLEEIERGFFDLLQQRPM